ncbi:hypothetical protein ACH4ZU_09495 [Streptomyces sp. NPDC020472]|uniref:hypothetical protein n=1 Tax=Streptomyces sp. NPDC020472 TaxID=3365075 RepID=UPI00379DECAB
MSAPVFTAPAAAEDVARMRRALIAAARGLQVAPPGPEVWGWRGRTLGRRAGTSWLRIVCAPSGKAGGRAAVGGHCARGRGGAPGGAASAAA